MSDSTETIRGLAVRWRRQAARGPDGKLAPLGAWAGFLELPEGHALIGKDVHETNAALESTVCYAGIMAADEAGGGDWWLGVPPEAIQDDARLALEALAAEVAP